MIMHVIVNFSVDCRNKLLNFRGMCISFLGRLMWFLISSFIFRGLLDEELDFVPPTQPGVLSCPQSTKSTRLIQLLLCILLATYNCVVITLFIFGLYIWAIVILVLGWLSWRMVKISTREDVKISTLTAKKFDLTDQLLMFKSFFA